MTNIQDSQTRGMWEVGAIGPLQLKRVTQAIKALRGEQRTHIELTGVTGDPESERRSRYWSPTYPVRDDVVAAEGEIAARFGPLTAANHKDVIAALNDAVVAARERTPVNDQRITADEHTRRTAEMDQRNAEQAAKQQARQASWDAVVAKAPAGAQAVIVATEHEDASDPMTDYFASKDVRAVAIGWRFSKRESFDELRAAAASFEPTAGLATPAAEHRDNYSMGAGNYLGQNPNWGSGWSVRSYQLSTTYPPHLPVEDHLPAPKAPVEGTAVRSSGGVTISPSSIGRAGVVEVHFAEKPDEQVRAQLKAAGFRWARSSSCWYGPESRLPSGLGA
jgi:hypothetical protein